MNMKLAILKLEEIKTLTKDLADSGWGCPGVTDLEEFL